MSDHNTSHAPQTAAHDPVENIVPMMPVVLPVVGGVLIFLLAFIAYTNQHTFNGRQTKFNAVYRDANHLRHKLAHALAILRNHGSVGFRQGDPLPLNKQLAIIVDLKLGAVGSQNTDLIRRN
mgnify:CR=1 FL=1